MKRRSADSGGSYCAALRRYFSAFRRYLSVLKNRFTDCAQSVRTKLFGASLRPHVLTRYLVRELLLYFSVAFLFFFTIFFVNQILLIAENILRQGAPVWDVVKLMTYSLPFIVAQSSPFATLVGFLMCLGRFMSDNEIIIFRASGFSYAHILTPVLVMGLAISIASFFVNDYLLPLGTIRYNRLRRMILSSNPAVALDSHSVKRLNTATLVTGDVSDTKVSDLVIIDMGSDGKMRIISAGESDLKSVRKEGVLMQLTMTDEKIREYSNIKETNDTRAATLVKFSGELSKLESVLLYLSIPDEDKLEIKNLAISKYDNLAETLQLGVKIPNEDPKVIPFVDGKINIPEVYHEDYNPLIEERRLILVEYAKEEAKKFEPITIPEDKAKAIEESTKKIDKELEALSIKKKRAVANNQLFHRFKMWEEWMESKSKYEALLDDLRKAYEKIETGVEGLKLVPNVTNTITEIWLKYNGAFDPEFFGNPEKETRFLFDYSASQRGVLGVILQASRLDEKPKALRLAILDDVPMTQKGIDVLLRICEERNIQLITSKTDDRYDKESLTDNEIVIEGGEVFFNNK